MSRRYSNLLDLPGVSIKDIRTFNKMSNFSTQVSLNTTSRQLELRNVPEKVASAATIFYFSSLRQNVLKIDSLVNVKLSIVQVENVWQASQPAHSQNFNAQERRSAPNLLSSGFFSLQVFQGFSPIFLSLPTDRDVSLQTTVESSLLLVFHKLSADPIHCLPHKA